MLNVQVFLDDDDDDVWLASNVKFMTQNSTRTPRRSVNQLEPSGKLSSRLVCLCGDGGGDDDGDGGVDSTQPSSLSSSRRRRITLAAGREINLGSCKISQIWVVK